MMFIDQLDVVIIYVLCNMSPQCGVSNKMIKISHSELQIEIQVV